MSPRFSDSVYWSSMVTDPWSSDLASTCRMCATPVPMRRRPSSSPQPYPLSSPHQRTKNPRHSGNPRGRPPPRSARLRRPPPCAARGQPSGVPFQRHACASPSHTPSASSSPWPLPPSIFPALSVCSPHVPSSSPSPSSPSRDAAAVEVPCGRPDLGPDDARFLPSAPLGG